MEGYLRFPSGFLMHTHMWTQRDTHTHAHTCFIYSFCFSSACHWLGCWSTDWAVLKGSDFIRTCLGAVFQVPAWLSCSVCLLRLQEHGWQVSVLFFCWLHPTWPASTGLSLPYFTFPQIHIYISLFSPSVLFCNTHFLCTLHVVYSLVKYLQNFAEKILSKAVGCPGDPSVVSSASFFVCHLSHLGTLWGDVSLFYSTVLPSG